jgi:hypothetical protein
MAKWPASSRQATDDSRRLGCVHEQAIPFRRREQMLTEAFATPSCLVSFCRCGAQAALLLCGMLLCATWCNMPALYVYCCQWMFHGF